MRIGLVLANNIWFAPYVSIYTSLFDKWQIDYDVIYWNRSEEKVDGANVFSKATPKNKVQKTIAYFQFVRFVRNRLKKCNYDKLVIFGSNVPIALLSFLNKRYLKRYILDFRDLGLEQVPILRRRYKLALENSYANVVSSPGFKAYLPDSVSYYLSHNFDIELVEKSLNESAAPYNRDPRIILTIGGIRDFSSNSEILDSLGNKDNYTIHFVGKGPAQQLLQDYSMQKGYNNVKFEGYYSKENESGYIKKATLINIHYPNIKSHTSALSNRFYNSLIFRRPMIVTEGGVQAEYAKKYDVGIVVNDSSDIEKNVENWLNNHDFDEYENRCKALLRLFIGDYESFKQMLLEFVKKQLLD